MKTSKNVLKAMVAAAIIAIFFINVSVAQTVPTILIDGTAMWTSNVSSAPYWLKAGQTLAIGNLVNSISVLQYNIAPASSGGNDLQFEAIISVTTVQTVPTNKGWKIESVALNPAAAPAISEWTTTGNTGTIAGTNFIGTIDATDWVVKTNNTEKMRVQSGGNVGIGTASPASTFSVGASSQFQVNSIGNLTKINNVTYSFPASQGAASNVLQNDGSGNLIWAAPATASCPAAPSGQTLINYNGCLYVRNIDQSGTYTWANALNACSGLGSGWYLPGKVELDILYQNWNQPANGGTCFGGACLLSGFVSDRYWTSSLHASSTAWTVNFSDGTPIYGDKPNAYPVRCVRR